VVYWWEKTIAVKSFVHLKANQPRIKQGGNREKQTLASGKERQKSTNNPTAPVGSLWSRPVSGKRYFPQINPIITRLLYQNRVIKTVAVIVRE